MLGLLVVSMAVSPAQTPPPAEHQVKAAIVANLPKYVDWPNQAFVSSNSPLVLCIAAPASLQTELRKMAVGKVIGGHPLDLRPLDLKAGIPTTTHVLFVSGLERKQTAELLRKCQGLPVLTVVEDDGDTSGGEIIRLVRKENKVRLAINAPAAKEVGLAISSKLLGVADAAKGRGQ